MKKTLIIASILMLPLATFGATQIAKEIKSYDFVASIQTVKGNTIYIYKFPDTNADCYTSVAEFGSSGLDQSIYCVKR